MAIPGGVELDLGGRHRLHRVEPPDVGDLLDRLDLRVTTMGRGPEEEPRFFAACGAAGMLAASFPL